MPNLSVYCAHQMTGLSFEEVEKYYEEIKRQFIEFGYEVYTPMACKEKLRGAEKFQSAGYTDKVTNNHAIVERDRWMVKKADILYSDLIGTETVSIGCIAELAWAHDNGKHTVVVMDKGNPHEHAFVYEMADVIFENQVEAIAYMRSLAVMGI